MLAKIQKWGNSQGLRLTKNLLSRLESGMSKSLYPNKKAQLLTIGL